MLPKRQKIILASGSDIRRQLLANAGLEFETVIPGVDEASIRNEWQALGLGTEEIALKLADAKAETVSAGRPNSIVIGADQILICDGRMFSKAKDRTDAKQQLELLSGATHRLISAVVVHENSHVAWQHTQFADLTMRPLSNDQIDDYLDRNWSQIRHCVGCYMLEREGSWLFSKISGDYFTVLGLPLLDLLGYLSSKGVGPS